MNRENLNLKKITKDELKIKQKIECEIISKCAILIKKIVFN